MTNQVELYTCCRAQPSKKTAIAAYITESAIPQLDLIDKIIAILSPAEEITQAISTEAASTSVIIPIIKAL